MTVQPQSEVHPGGHLRLATYNVHSCIGTDRRFHPDRIADILCDIDADVVALQELGWHHRGKRGFDQFEYIRQRTGYTVLEGPTKLHDRAHYGNAVLLKGEPRAVRPVDLSFRFHIPRGALVVALDTKVGPLTVINAHLGLTPWDRQRQVRLLMAELDALQGPTVLMGDFNSWQPEGRIFRPIASRLPVYTRSPTFHARNARLPLDRIYLSKDMDLASVEVWRHGAAAVASDHLPLVADVRLPAR